MSGSLESVSTAIASSIRSRSVDSNCPSAQVGSCDTSRGDPTRISSISRRSAHSKHPFKSWALEMLSTLFAAIVSILVYFDGQTKPEWGYSINLNTLVALLSTIARAFILVTVAGVLGQAKWLWFLQQSRPLSHLEQFDVASRGWTGSFRLLSSLPRDPFALGSCLVIILSLAIGPFAQQAIKTTTCPQYSEQARASIPIAHHMGYPRGDYRPYSIGAGADEVTLPADMKGAMVNGFVNLMGNDSALSAFCPTGNCTFQAAVDGITYSSIGLCSACIETTSFVTSSGPDVFLDGGIGDDPLRNITVFVNWTLPNGMWTYLGVREPLLNISTEPNLTWASSAFTEEFRQVAINAITNVTILSFTQAPCSNVSGTLSCPRNITSGKFESTWDYVAASCTLYPCLKNYHRSVREGVLSETVVSTLPTHYNWMMANGELSWEQAADIYEFDPRKANFTALKKPCNIEGREYTAENNYSGLPQSGRRLVPITLAGTNYTAPLECVYSLDRSYKLGMKSFFGNTLFQRGCIWALPTEGEPECDPAWHGGYHPSSTHDKPLLRLYLRPWTSSPRL